MSTFSNRTYNELYIETSSGQSIIDSNICRNRQRSITWATRNNKIHYFDPRKRITKKDELEYESETESESESNYIEDDLCSDMCLIS